MFYTFLSPHELYTQFLSKSVISWNDNAKTDSLVKKMFRAQRLLKKVMLIDFWDMKGLKYIENLKL